MNFSDPEHFHGEISGLSSSPSAKQILQEGVSARSCSVTKKPSGSSTGGVCSSYLILVSKLLDPSPMLISITLNLALPNFNMSPFLSLYPNDDAEFL